MRALPLPGLLDDCALASPLMDSRSNIRIKVDALQRAIMTYGLSGVLPLYIVTEYPKSGGTWVGQMISEYLQVPFPRNVRPPMRSCVMHGHMLHSRMFRNVLCVMRDGRDVMVSEYFHSLFQNDRNSPLLVARTRKALDFADADDVNRNLPRFIEYVFESKCRSVSPFQFTWSQFVRSWTEHSVAIVRYEHLVLDGVSHLEPALERLTGARIDSARLAEIFEKYSFVNQAKRPPGQENRTSFLRKGRPGDWTEKFSREARHVFDYYAGAELVMLGYEKNRKWVDESYNGA